MQRRELAGALMARRRTEITLGASELPDYLKWSGMDDPRFFEGPIAPAGEERFFAHRRHRQARREFLASTNTCPLGVRPGEFLQAHGFLWTDTGDPKTRHLNY